MADRGLGAGPLREVAQHEAGHALVCFLLCGEQVIKRMRIARGPAGSLRGSTTTYSRLPLPSELRGDGSRGRAVPVDAIVDAHGVICYAGAASEDLREPGRAGAAAGEIGGRRAREDRETLARLARSLGAERPAERLYAEYRDEAARLVALHWQAVCELAELLADRSTLRGHRVDALLRSWTRTAIGAGWAASAPAAGERVWLV